MGIVCPTGNSVAEAWGNAAAGKSGIAPFTLFDTTGMDNPFGGEVKNFDP
jgi:3-oxoacyl-[acyl-carrier-protein] synthase II